MKKIYLVILDDFVLPFSTWDMIFNDLNFIEIVNTIIPEECDAVVVSPTLCEIFGCHAGSSEENSGVMSIYDQDILPKQYRHKPRFLISNAVWQKEPKLLKAVQYRVKALTQVLTVYNKSTFVPIQRIAIKTEILGFWQRYSKDSQEKAIHILKDELIELYRVMGDNESGKNSL